MSDDKKRREALLYHAKPQPGKIKVVPTKKYATQRDLSLAYSPGVAEPCIEISKDIDKVYKYTAKGNLVAVISNGTAVLGLGNIGPEASKPVMEGKALLFKIFSDIDVFDIEVDATDIDKFVDTVKAIAPTFGGINLEDIKAPESFEIERRLVEELNIPVMHDDQHGTAIISSAALLNALELAEKDIDKIKVVVSGAGSAALACANLYVALGVKIENIFMFDVNGLLVSSREDISDLQRKYAKDIPTQTLGEIIVGADMFLGLSAGNVLKPEMLLTMAENPIVFAMANPVPEIDYNLAISTREDIIMATGRSDYPNQVNNVLGFPYIFRGALDVRATKINEAMKMAAVKALACLAKQPVPEQVNIAYGETKLVFGRDYIIPKPFDPRLIAEVAPAVAKAAIESGVAQQPITDWEKYRNELLDRLGSDNKMVRMLANRAKTNPKKVVFAEADHLDVLKAAQIVFEEGIGMPILLGNKEIILELKEELGFDAEVEIIDPKTKEEEERKNRFAQKYWETRRRRGITLLDAQKWMRERNYFAAMMINEGEADALVTGYSRSYPSVVKPIMELIGKGAGVSRIATTNLMMTARGPMFLADTAINPNPTAEDLAKIALMTARTIKLFGMEPVMAMVSFSNFGSSKDESASKVREAVAYLHTHHPDLIVDGEIQTDFALNPEMLKSKFPFSKLAGQKVNTLVFPNLESANITYKMLKELYKVDSIGPIMLGLDKPVHIFQLGASVEEMVNMATIAVIDAQEKEKRHRTQK
ncbi:NADP-dependent malic enzyme [Flavobacterium columnare]|uniref:Bifunctional malic enzyme oxidoreductase/phosphotransacetylase n=2 Tax=Flavobacterium columnare TaxID=996 RepID=G8X5M7_FLACA|nr:NADP-dependent malic enzyme [Flavobacterium columnare]AEW86871.1 bifunctional malic enzyme oxidoreductase/phosphotransacetylase [Flavobacterium columnare ATCC 49512]AMO20784.1 NADP-dependent malic enzyme [Flavobacterium columnare]AUX18768.1 malic enzyme [Flavobacterium columnare]MEB3801797.1 NADP-dependent malic enzyme [Flavobacterium columnare]PTD14426.1 NADP-dependent malic enzyme [Flavobacterium columnare]